MHEFTSNSSIYITHKDENDEQSLVIKTEYVQRATKLLVAVKSTFLQNYSTLKGIKLHISLKNCVT